MFPGAKLLLGLVTTVIFGSAVGIPLSFSSGRSSTTSKGGAKDLSVQVVKCNSSETGAGTTVNFGDLNYKEVCWSIEQAGVTTSATSADSHVSSLFSEMGPQKNGTGSTKSSNKWRNMCATGGSNQFVLPNASGGQSNGKEYVGLCDDSEGASQGISVEKRQPQEQEKDSLIIKTCTGDQCGTTATSDDQSGGGGTSANIKNFQ